MIKETTESFKEFFHLWQDMTMNMVKNPMEFTAKAFKPEQYEKFYELYSKQMNEMMEKVMRTPGFATQSWDLFKGTREFHKYMDSMVEQSLKHLKIPTHKDINFMSERLNHLEDRLTVLEEKLAQGSGKSAPKAEEEHEAKAAKTAAPSKAKKGNKA
jgi:hypothetical protein